MEVNLVALGSGAVARGAGATRYDSEEEEEEDDDAEERRHLARMHMLEEIAAVGRAPPPTLAARITPKLEASIEQMAGAITKLTNQMSGLHKEMDKLKGQTLYVAPKPEGAAKGSLATKFVPNKWVDGVPICFECKELGHKGKECPIRIARLTGRSGNGNAPQ